MFEIKEYIGRFRVVAIDVLERFEAIASSASESITDLQKRQRERMRSEPGEDPILRRALLAHGSRQIEEEKLLAHRPVIARIRLENPATSEEEIIHITPAAVSGGASYASYGSPVGRLASMDIGSSGVAKYENFKIIEKYRFNPKRDSDGWDSQNTQYEGYGNKDNQVQLTIPFLRKLIGYDDVPFEGEPPSEEQSVQEKQTAEKGKENLVRAGFQRETISQMELRENPILDKFQDEIFRLPVDSHILLLGPAGTGKSTTLIKRLGQKKIYENLLDDEKKIIDRIGYADNLHSSWLVFTPTNVLRDYIKEALNRENIPASDDHVNTWNDYAHNIARKDFGILKTATGGSFILRSDLQNLQDKTNAGLVRLYDEFASWEKGDYFAILKKSANHLSGHEDPRISQIGEKLLDILNKPASISALKSVARWGREASMRQSELKKDTDKEIQSIFNFARNRNAEFLEGLADFLEQNDLLNRADEEDEGEDDDARNQEGEAVPEISRIERENIAAQSYRNALRSLARARAQGRKLPTSSKSALIIDWLAGHIPADERLQTIGGSLITQTELGRFRNPVRSYINGMAARYRKFRRGMMANKRLFHDNFKPNDISPLELDVILLAVMQGTNELLRNMSSTDISNSPAKDLLERQKSLHKAQVLIDEVSDFSAIQIMCMSEIAHPDVSSIFASGDFNQRATEYGITSEEDIKWVRSSFITRNISRSYRQSDSLYLFAHKIAGTKADDIDKGSTGYFTNHKGVPPALAENLAEPLDVAEWLGARIQEIDKSIKVAPSIAVLVNSKEDGEKLMPPLQEVLEEQNIKVQSCLEGGGIGSDRNVAVRLFKIEDIKGLEFEAVFFVGIDKFAKAKPDLLDKYLYVGASRAATFFGITCEGTLPEQLAGMDDSFTNSWSDDAQVTQGGSGGGNKGAKSKIISKPESNVGDLKWSILLALVGILCIALIAWVLLKG